MNGLPAEETRPFHPASDHIPHAGKMVVGGDGEIAEGAAPANEASASF